MSIGLRGLAVLIAIAASLPLSACGNDGDTGPPKLAIEITDPTGEKAVMDAPESIGAGLVEIELENRGNTLHDAQLFRYEGERSAQDLIGELLSSLDVAPKPDWLSPVGGVARTSPGETVSVTQVLRPGNYFIADTQEKPAGWPVSNASKGAISKLRVTGATDATLPPAPASIVAGDGGFRVKGIEAGTNRVRFENAGRELHQAVAFPIPEGIPFGEAKRRLIARKEELSWVPVFEPHGQATSVLDGGVAQITELELEPGRYALVCLVSDRSGGETHLTEGVATELNVE
jgi:hypothetical protein